MCSTARKEAIELLHTYSLYAQYICHCVSGNTMLGGNCRRGGTQGRRVLYSGVIWKWEFLSLPTFAEAKILIANCYSCNICDEQELVLDCIVQLSMLIVRLAS